MSSSRKIIPGLAVAVVLLAAAPANAALTVANTNDSGAGSLRQAIAEAGPGETINVPAGDYQLTSAELEIHRSVTIAGAGSATTTIRSIGPYRDFIIGPTGMEILNVTISGVTIRDGRAFEASAAGAGVLAINTNLTLRDARLTGNIADANGEAPGVEGETAIGAGALVVAGSLAVSESEVSGNIAEAVGGPAAAGGTAQGGAMAVVGGAVSIERSTISGNVANAGGGHGPSNAEQDGGVAGGAGLFFVLGGSQSSIVASTISGNVAEATPGAGGEAGEVVGGGIFGIAAEQGIALTNSTIVENVARNGGGAGSGGFGGGAFLISGEAAPLTVTDSTIAANRLETGNPESVAGNLFAAGPPGTLKLSNSIVANGVGPAGSENCFIPTESIPTISSGFNLDSRDQCGFHAAGDQVNKDPLLGPLASNGGPTQTMAPALGSPAIDQGAAFGQTADQRAVLRPIDLPSIPNAAVTGADGSDIGAVEVQPSNAFKLGKLKKNKKKGTATLSVSLAAPSAGTMTLSGKGLKTQKAIVAGQASIKLKVVARSKRIRKALRKKGRRKVQFTVSYTPTGNVAASLKRKAKLVKKLKKKHRKRSTR